LGYRKSTISVLGTTVPTHRYQKSTLSVLVTTIPSYLAPSCLVPGPLDPGTGYQDIKIPSRARPNSPVPWVQYLCPGAPKSLILRPTPQHAVMYRKHIIYYTFATFLGCQGHQNIGIWGTQNQQFRYWSPQYPHIGTKNQHFRYWSPQDHHVAWYQAPWILAPGTKILKYLRARGPIPVYPGFIAPGHQNH